MNGKSLAAAGLALLAAAGFTPAGAQDNRLFILQENTASGSPNAIFVDQSRARQSNVGTSEAPAEQIGGGNAADIAISGLGARVALSQEAAVPFVRGNSVSLNLSGTGITSQVSQAGSGNTGRLRVEGAGSAAALRQTGDFNSGEVTVLGDNASGTLQQLGSDNETGLRVEGAGTDVTYSVIGNGLSEVVPPSVISNGARVTITRTVLGGSR
jgi:hypothetical protein